MDSIVVQAFLFVGFMLCATYFDLKKREIPAFVCVGIVITAVLDFHVVNLFGILAALPFFIAAYMYPEKMGGGDIKYVAATGMVLGLQATNYGVIIGLSVLVIAYLFYRAFKIVTKKQGTKNFSLPLAPFLSLGFLVVYFMKFGGFYENI